MTTTHYLKMYLHAGAMTIHQPETLHYEPVRVGAMHCVNLFESNAEFSLFCIRFVEENEI